jgi:hypothetical protein
MVEKKKISGRTKAISQGNMISAHTQTTDNDIIPGAGRGVWSGSGDCCW